MCKLCRHTPCLSGCPMRAPQGPVCRVCGIETEGLLALERGGRVICADCARDAVSDALLLATGAADADAFWRDELGFELT